VEAQKISGTFVLAGQIREQKTELDCVFLIDLLLRQAFEGIPALTTSAGNTFEIILHRDSTSVVKMQSSSIIENARPDFFATVGKYTICFIGEGKANAKHNPEDDIFDKLKVWSVACRGNSPLLFGHLSWGLTFQFVAIDVENKMVTIG
jgi:hypothetical protein